MVKAGHAGTVRARVRVRVIARVQVGDINNHSIHTSEPNPNPNPNPEPNPNPNPNPNPIQYIPLSLQLIFGLCRSAPVAC